MEGHGSEGQRRDVEKNPDPEPEQCGIVSGGDVAPGSRCAVGHAVAGRGAAVAGRHFEQVARRVGPETAVGVGVGKLEAVEFAVIGFVRNPGDDFQREVRRAGAECQERAQGPGEMLSRAGVGQGDADIGDRIIHKAVVSVHFFSRRRCKDILCRTSRVNRRPSPSLGEGRSWRMGIRDGFRFFILFFQRYDSVAVFE